MDQASYAAWLDIAVTTQLRVANHQGDDSRVLNILRGQVALWTEAADQLEAFDQPAARGWQADLAHSRVMALRAKLQYSVAAGRPLTSYDRQVYQQAAAQHLDTRLQDFQTGTGTAVSVLAAARMVDEQLVSPAQASGSAGGAQDVSVATFQVDRPVAIRAALAEIRRARSSFNVPSSYCHSRSRGRSRRCSAGFKLRSVCRYAVGRSEPGTFSDAA